MILVRLERRGDVAVIRIDNPPVNAASQAVRQGLMEVIGAFAADSGLHGAVLACAGRTFVAGADVAEFGRPAQPPRLAEVCAALAALDKPVVAALHGTALGGGFELALACPFRVIDEKGRVGLPEVTLGLIPGAGGTQRLPRRIGLGPALDLIASGRQVGAEEALRLGLVDAVAEGDLVEFAISVLGRSPVPLPDTLPPDPGAVEAAREAATRRMPGQEAPLRAIEVIEAGTRRPLAEGLALEANAFAVLRGSDQATALRHLFFAERAVAKIPEIEGVEPPPLACVGVIGGGTMGAGIAAALLLAGLDVTLIERDGTALEAGRDRIAAILAESVRRGKLAAERRDAILAGALAASTAMRSLSPCDLVIEAVFEDVAVKQAVFRDLDRVAKAGAVLATNTSYLDVAALAAVAGRPGDVIGLHFFSPAHVMRLLEIVVPDGAAPRAVAAGFALARRLGKTAVRAGNAEGFIGNRILSAYKAAADGLVMDGASPWAVDAAFKALGFPLGVFEMQDMAGLDIGWATRKRLAAVRPPEARVTHVSDRICEAGHFGRKTGRGYYLYDGVTRPDPWVDDVVAEERARAGVAVRAFSEADIQDRLLAAMANEGARLLGEGVALRAGDIDVVMTAGYGFPRWRGGPMHHADARGLHRLVKEIGRFAEEDPWLWRPAPLLMELAASGRGLTG